MLRKQQPQDNQRRQIQLPRQVNPPQFADIEFLLEQAGQNPGRTIELVFGQEPITHALTVLKNRPKDEDGQWMFYQLQEGNSKLEWSQTTGDCSMIHSAICAQFPEVDMDITNAALPGQTFSLSMGEDYSAPAPHQQAAVPKTSDAAPKAKSLMEGQLEHLHISNVLQSVGSGKMTGRLEVAGENDTCNLYFKDGVLSHCTVQGLEGEQAVLEVVAWQRGYYRFLQEPPYPSQTVKKRMETLLLEGATLQDQNDYLAGKGLKLECFLYRINPNLTEQQFEEIAGKSTPCGMALLKGLYQTIDNKSSLLEILRRKPLGKPEWVPALHNMVSANLVGFAAAPVIQQVEKLDDTQIPTTNIDWAQVRSIERPLLRPDTGVLSYPAFLGMVEKEQLRFEVLYRPYSLVIIEMGVIRNQQAGQVEPLSINAFREIASRLDSIRRKCDVIGHFETFALAILLPETGSASAKNFSRIAGEIIMSDGRTDEGHRIMMKIGVGSIPEDCRRIETLLTVTKPGS